MFWQSRTIIHKEVIREMKWINSLFFFSFFSFALRIGANFFSSSIFLHTRTKQAAEEAKKTLFSMNFLFLLYNFTLSMRNFFSRFTRNFLHRHLRRRRLLCMHKTLFPYYYFLFSRERRNFWNFFTAFSTQHLLFLSRASSSFKDVRIFLYMFTTK